MARDQTQLLAMGARIKELRESHGLKQQWIADQVGVSLRTYQFWQEGKSPPSQDNLEKLADIFGVTTRYIMRGDTPDLSGSAGRLERIEADVAYIKRLTEMLAGDAIVQAVHQATRQAAQQDAEPGRDQAA